MADKVDSKDQKPSSLSSGRRPASSKSGTPRSETSTLSGQGSPVSGHVSPSLSAGVSSPKRARSGGLRASRTGQRKSHKNTPETSEKKAPTSKAGSVGDSAPTASSPYDETLSVDPDKFSANSGMKRSANQAAADRPVTAPGSTTSQPLRPAPPAACPVQPTTVAGMPPTGSEPQSPAEDAAVTITDARESVPDLSIEKPHRDPREPLSHRAQIDRHVLLGEVVVAEPPSVRRATIKGVADPSAQKAEAEESDEDLPAEDPREPLKERATIDRRVSLGQVVVTTPPTPVELILAEVNDHVGEQDAREVPALADDDTTKDNRSEDPREPLKHRALIDRRVSMGHIIPTIPSPPPSAPRISKTHPARDNAELPGTWASLANASTKDQKDRYANRPLIVVSVIVLCVLLIVSVVSLAFVSFPRRAARASTSDVCNTSDCSEHAAFILATLDDSADPCVDLYTHVCGKARQRDLPEPTRSVGSALARAYSWDVNNTFIQIQELLETGPKSTAALKAFKAFEICMDPHRNLMGERFAQFMGERGIPWPLPPAANASHSHVLGVLIDLAVNWRAALWFDVNVRRPSAYNADPVVVIGEAGDLPLLRMHELSSADDGTYAKVARDVAFLLTSGNVTLSESSVKELQPHESAFRSVLLEGPDDNANADVLVPVGQISMVFGSNVSSAEWVALLDERLKSALSVSATTNVLILNERKFSHVGELMRSRPARRLLDVAGWMFAYSYAWIASPNSYMLSSTTGDKHLLETVQCILTTQESFGIALFAPMFQSAFGGVHERTKVADSLSWISATLVQLLLASKDLPELTKSGAVAKISKLASRYLRPPEPLLSVDSFDQLYANFSENYTTFFETWLHSRRSLRQSLADPYYATLMTARYRQHSGVFLYLYSLNELWPTMAAVFPPLYRRNGVPAMAYAGLGFQFARQLMRSIDDRGRTVDSAGRNVSWWQQLGERSLCRYDKATSPEERRQLADLFALSLARDAMKTSAPRTSGSSQPARLPSLEKLTEEQTFYVSYCSHYCGEPRGKLMCNLAMNDSHFPRAFSCKREQPQDLSSCLVV